MRLDGQSLAPIIVARTIYEARERARNLGRDILEGPVDWLSGTPFRPRGETLEVGDPVPLHATVRGHKR